MLISILVLFIICLFTFVWIEIGYLRMRSHKVHQRFVELIAVHPLTGMLIYLVSLLLWFLPMSYHRFMSSQKVAVRVAAVMDVR